MPFLEHFSRAIANMRVVEIRCAKVSLSLFYEKNHPPQFPMPYFTLYLFIYFAHFSFLVTFISPNKIHFIKCTPMSNSIRANNSFDLFHEKKTKLKLRCRFFNKNRINFLFVKCNEKTIVFAFFTLFFDSAYKFLSGPPTTIAHDKNTSDTKRKRRKIKMKKINK